MFLSLSPDVSPPCEIYELVVNCRSSHSHGCEAVKPEPVPKWSHLELISDKNAAHNSFTRRDWWLFASKLALSQHNGRDAMMVKMSSAGEQLITKLDLNYMKFPPN